MMVGASGLDHVSRGFRHKRAETLRGSILDELVIEILGVTNVPLGAYSIAERLRERRRSGNMMAIYRSLDRLCKRDVIERVESLSAYRLRTAAGAVLMACARCGTTTPLPVEAEFSAIDKAVRDAGFLLNKLALEAVGICASCRTD